MDTLRLAQGCRLCPELAANRRVIVHGYGSLPARVLLVGEAPGHKGGDVTGVPFTRDRSGVRLQQALIDLGLSAEVDPRVERPRLHCFLTNVVRCNPPANRTPTQAEIDHYWARLGEGGDPAAQQCGWLADRYGVSWQITPRLWEQFHNSADAAGAQRAMKALMGMKKLDIAQLQAAFDGAA